MSRNETTFYDCANPPRAVRVHDGQVEQLTPEGWRHAPWLNPDKKRLGANTISKELFRQQSLQRLNSTTPDAGAVSARSQIFRWAGRLTDWLLPPLPYGAPWYLSASQYEEGIRAYCRDSHFPDSDEYESQELLSQAREGYERQESRVAEIENRASGYDGYAAAAAALAALGATLLGSGKTKAFGSVGQPLLIALLVAATACLILSGFRAWQAAAKRYDWMRPNEPSVVWRRFATDAPDPPRPDPPPSDPPAPRPGSRDHLLVSLLIAAERGQLLADWKRARFRQGSRAFSLALIFVILAAIILVDAFH